MSALLSPLPVSLAIPMIALRLRVEVAEDGWRVLLQHRDGRSVSGQVRAAAAAHAVQAARQARFLEGGPVLLRPGDDVARAAAELAAGRALSAVLTASAQISAQLAWYRGQALQAGEDLLLAVEAEDAALRALPWELLCADADGLHLEGDGVCVVRLAAGAPRAAPPPHSTLRTRCWRPDETEPLSGALLEALHRATRAAALPPPEAADSAETIGQDAVPSVLHVLCHGAQEQAQLALLVDEERRSAGGAAEALRDALPTAELVVLSVCEAGAALPGERDGLVGHLLACGARAVVAPAEEWSVEAAEAFLEGLYPALASGASLSRAVSEGRRAVRALALPYPDARWWGLVLTASSLDLPSQVLRSGWRPAGWPRPHPEAAALLQRAHELAQASGAGFVGLEHIALTLASTPVDPWLAQARHQLRAHQPLIEQRLGRLSASESGAPDWQGTPRLCALGAHLGEGFTLLELWTTLLAQAQPAMRWLLGAHSPRQPELTSDATHQSESSSLSSHAGPGGALEVLGGPEDGRRLTFLPDARIGRWHTTPRCELPLYQGAALRDRSLSRDGAVRWLAPALLEALRPIALERPRSAAPTVPISPGARCELQVGDRLKIADATWLLVVAGP